MNWNLFWDLFPLVFFNVDYGTSLLFSWGGAVILGFVLIFLSQKGLATKGFVYLAMGIVSLVYILVASTGGLQYFAVFLSVTFLWLTTDYLLVVVTEWKLVTWREARDFIFPWFYKWYEKKEVKTAREADEGNLSYFELAKEGYRIRFGLKESVVKKTIAPRKQVKREQAWKIQLWFIFGTAFFLVLIGFIGKWLGY